MSERLDRKRKLDILELRRRKPDVLQATVTATSPLEVSVAGAEPVEAVGLEAGGPYAVDDRVNVMQWLGNRLVLGIASDDPQGSGGGGGVTLPIAESDVTGLVADLASFLAKASNLADLSNAATARNNLGLGSLATLSAIASAQITDGTIVNADINAAAAIAYGKLALTSSIINGDIASGAAIAYAKLNLSGSIVLADIASSLKPTGTAGASDLALRALGAGSTQAAAGDDSRFPTAGQKNALDGTSGTPGSTNKYVTNSDSRNSDARTPTAHAASHASGGSDPLTLAESQITGLLADLAAKAAINSPTFTGTPLLTTTPALGDDSHKIADTAFVERRAVLAAQGFKVKPPIDGLVQNQGASNWGQSGNTLTYTGTTIPSSAVGSRLLYYDGSTADTRNGIYTVTSNGGNPVATTVMVLERSTDADVIEELVGAMITVPSWNTTYICTATLSDVLNTTPINFTSYPGRDTRISAFGATLVDDTSAAAARATLGLNNFGTYFPLPNLANNVAVAQAGGTLMYGQVVVHGDQPLTGVICNVTVTGGFSGKALLFDSSGTKLKDGTGTALVATQMKLPFVSAYTPTPGRYFIALICSGAATLSHTTSLAPAGTNASGSYATPPASITVPTTPATVPTMSTY